jgi:hypothetical protein
VIPREKPKLSFAYGVHVIGGNQWDGPSIYIILFAISQCVYLKYYR